MPIDIDPHSGFCAGVQRAIRAAEEGLKEGPLYCLGDIVHNGEECARLEAMGLETIDYDDLRTIHGGRVLLRAHGEPPSTYRIAEQNGLTIHDATCPVVLKLQSRIRETYQAHPGAQIVIFGHPGHAEVIGLCGQTSNTAIVIDSVAEADRLDLSRDSYLFSQTTKSVDDFRALIARIEQLRAQRYPDITTAPVFEHHDTICRSVSNRVSNLQDFARAHEVVIFVGGSKSSNARVLYTHCKAANPNTIFISSPDELPDIKAEHVGITGATSTPQWLMEEVKEQISNLANKQNYELYSQMCGCPHLGR